MWLEDMQEWEQRNMWLEDKQQQDLEATVKFRTCKSESEEQIIVLSKEKWQQELEQAKKNESEEERNIMLDKQHHCILWC